MGKLIAPVVDSGFPENDVFSIYLVVLIDILCMLEPHQIYNAAAVRKMSNHSFFACSYAELLKREDLPFHLYIRHAALQVLDGIDLTPVNVFIRIIL